MATMVYELHTAQTPKGVPKYNVLKSKDLPSSLRLSLKLSRSPTISAKFFWPDDFEVQYMLKKKAGDLGCVGAYLIMTGRAADALHDLLEPHGEFLPVYCKKDHTLKLFRVMTRPVGALDETKAVIKYLDDEKKQPFHVEEHWFIEEKVKDLPIFKLPETPFTYVTEPFLERVRENNLKGFGFRKLWSSELGLLHSKDLYPPYPAGEDINW
jgi:hypothetical protein